MKQSLCKWSVLNISFYNGYFYIVQSDVIIQRQHNQLGWTAKNEPCFFFNLVMFLLLSIRLNIIKILIYFASRTIFKRNTDKLTPTKVVVACQNQKRISDQAINYLLRFRCQICSVSEKDRGKTQLWCFKIVCIKFEWNLFFKQFNYLLINMQFILGFSKLLIRNLNFLKRKNLR